MTRTVSFVGARGGQGTSTVAAVFACDAASDTPTSLLSHDPVAMAHLLGVSAPLPGEPTRVKPQLTLAGLGGPRASLTVIDAGPATGGLAERFPGERYAVVRGPCYLSLATLLSHPDLRLDGVVLLAEPGRSLNTTDVRDVLDLPVVAVVPVRPGVARLVDAGVIATRAPRLGELSALRRDIDVCRDAGRPFARPAAGIRQNGARPSADFSCELPR